jgi:uncharacterized membrane protein YozB (DUF420 family)
VEGKELFALINSGLNGLSTILLIAAFVFVKKRQFTAHGITMTLALVSSAVFLGCYLYSKYAFGQLSMDIPMGWFKGVYLLILIPHLILAILMLPGIAVAVFAAATRRWPLHVKVVRYTWPVWLYVSVTGILVYLMLFQLFPALYPEAYEAALRSNLGQS